MMTCERAKAQLNNLLDDTLPHAQKTLLLAHLDTCADCKHEYDILSAVVLLVRESPVADSRASRDRVMTRFRQTVTAENFVPRKAAIRIPFVPLGMAAAAAAGLTILLIVPSLNAPNAPEETIVSQPVATSKLPTALELDRMASLHSAHSAMESAPNSELHSQAHADALARLVDATGEDSL